MSRPNQRILLIGWDAADWQVIRPLLDAGALPNLLRMIEDGVSGNLASLRPVVSPLLWNSIATGRLADAHGVLGFSEVNSGSQIQPFRSGSRSVKALWNILAENGFRCHVANWPASHPAEQTNGIAVSEAFVRHLHEEDETNPPPVSGVHPHGHAAELSQCAVRPEDIDAATIRLFVPGFAEIDQDRDPHLIELARLLAECFTTHAVATHLVEATPWDFAAVFYPTLNQISREFMRFRAPRLEHVSRVEFEFYREVVDAAYRLHDLLLGRLIDLAGPDTTVILCSAHGYQSGKLRVSRLRGPIQPQSLEHRPVGVLVVKGPGIRRDQLVHGAGILDIVPTLLTMAGLPVARDLNGRVLADLFEKSPSFTWIDSWEKHELADSPRGESDCAHASHPPVVDGSLYAAAVCADNDWALAMVYLFSGRLRNAVPLLEHIFETFPLRFDVGLMLGECYLRAGLIEEGEAIVKHIAAAIPRNARVKTLLATVHNARGEFLDALQLLQSIESSLKEESPDFCTLLGWVYQRLNQPVEAIRCYERALELEPDSSVAWLGKARCLLKCGDYENSRAAALEALAREYALGEAHLVLGICFVRLRDPDRAIPALETSLKFNPHRPVAIKYLLDLYSARQGCEPEILRLQALAKQHLLAGARKRRSSMELQGEMRARVTARTEHAFKTVPEVVSGDSTQVITVRPMRPCDISQVVTLLPDAVRQPSRSLVDIFEVGEKRSMAGCCLLVFSDTGQAYLEWAFLPEFDVSHLLAPVLSLMCEQAQRRGATAVVTGRAFASGSAESTGLRNAGFSVSNVYQWYQTDLSAGARLFERALERLARSERIPSTAKVVPLAEAPATAVRSLLGSEVGGAVSIEQFADEFSQRHSWVVLEGVRVVGATLMILTDGTPRAPWMAIDPAFRNGWVYVLLMEAAHRSLIAAGFEVVQFKTNPAKHPGMRNFATRVGARELRSESHFVCELPNVRNVQTPRPS